MPPHEKGPNRNKGHSGDENPGRVVQVQVGAHGPSLLSAKSSHTQMEAMSGLRSMNIHPYNHLSISASPGIEFVGDRQKK